LRKFVSKHLFKIPATGSSSSGLGATASKEYLNHVVARCIRDYMHQKSQLRNHPNTMSQTVAGMDCRTTVDFSQQRDENFIAGGALPLLSMEKDCWDFVWEALQKPKRTKDSGYGSRDSVFYGTQSLCKSTNIGSEYERDDSPSCQPSGAKQNGPSISLRSSPDMADCKPSNNGKYGARALLHDITGQSYSCALSGLGSWQPKSKQRLTPDCTRGSILQTRPDGSDPMLADIHNLQTLAYRNHSLDQRHVRDPSASILSDQPCFASDNKLQLEGTGIELKQNTLNLATKVVPVSTSNISIVNQSDRAAVDDGEERRKPADLCMLTRSYIGETSRSESTDVEVSDDLDASNQAHDHMSCNIHASESGFNHNSRPADSSIDLNLGRTATTAWEKYSESTFGPLSCPFGAEKEEEYDDDCDEDLDNDDDIDYHDTGFGSDESSYLEDNDSSVERNEILLHGGEVIGLHDRISRWQESTQFRDCPSGSGTSSGSRNSKHANSSNGRSTSTTARKHKRDNNDPEAPEGNGEGHRKKQSRIDIEDDGTRLKCPFFQREPNRYRLRYSCRGHGWTSMKHVM
jgi:hypothetical protein